MEHKVFVNSDGLIEIQYEGNVTHEDNFVAVKKAYGLITSIMDEGKEAKMLINLSKVKNVDPSVLGISPSALRDGEFTKMAAFGVDDKDVIAVLDEIEKKSGTVDKARHFGTREEAVAWLME